MKFRSPFFELQSEFYKLATNADEMDFAIFDSGVSIPELKDYNKRQQNKKYGVIADIAGTTSSSKTDSIVWNMSIRVELFSRYDGRKEVAEMITKIGEVVTAYEEIFSINMAHRGFNILNIQIGNTAIGAPLMDGSITWQNGFITINYTISQIENE